MVIAHTLINAKPRYVSIVIFIYFFLNSWGLPHGLLYTTVLTPLFSWWLFANNQKNITTKFLLPYSCFVTVQFLYGIEAPIDYFRSSFIYFSVYIFIYTVRLYLYKENSIYTIDHNIKKLLNFNLILILVALLFVSSEYKSLFWYTSFLADNISKIPRLKLLTYEPSYYAFLFVPIFFYFYTYVYFNRWREVRRCFLLTLLPILLSFSMGAYLNIPLTILVFLVINLFLRYRNHYNSYALFIYLLLSISALFIVFLLFPGNAFFTRFQNIIAGQDLSGNGRTFEAFALAIEVAKEKNIWFGVGAGQVKIVGNEIIGSFYKSDIDPKTGLYLNTTIINSTAETLAIFGVIGLVTRFFLEIYLFVKFKVYTSTFRFLLFIYMFIYQFTGSYITNIAEYLIWAICFSTLFPDTMFVKRRRIVAREMSIDES